MKTYSIKQLIMLEEAQQIQTKGWIDTIRYHKDFVFIVLREKTDFIQLFLSKEILGDVELKEESIIEVFGDLIISDSIRLHQREVKISSLQIISKPFETLPISWKFEAYPGQDSRFDHRMISLREPKVLLSFEIMSFAESKIVEYCVSKGFIQIHTPKIIGTPSESGAEVFEIDYFDQKAYLAQSPQFYKQMAIASGFEKVMEIGPVFRAEPSFTTRHVTEFTGLDFEIGYVSSIQQLIDFQQGWLVYMFEQIKIQYGEKIKEFYGFDLLIPSVEFPQLTIEEAFLILERDYGLIESGDLSTRGEFLIGEYVKKTYGHDFVFITHYPVSVRPFYHMREKECFTKSYDLIYRGVEITTGALREHRYEILKQQAIEKKLSTEHLEFYLEFFKYGVPPHGGMGVGFARIFKQMLGIESVKELCFIPRDPKRLLP